MTYATMGDAAFAANLDGTSFDIVAGYYGGPNAFHRWPVADWDRFPGYRLPIWVGGQNGLGEGSQAVASLEALRVPHGCVTVLDMEGRKDITYVQAFGQVLHDGGYKTWVYGSDSTIGLNPPLNGYWVADYGTNPRVGLDQAQIDDLMAHPHTRAVQYREGPFYDYSQVKPWTEGEMWHG